MASWAYGIGSQAENIGKGEERAYTERQRKIVDTLANQRAQIENRQLQTRSPFGQPYRAQDGKTYQRFYDPVKGQVFAEEVPGGQQEATDLEQKVQLFKKMFPGATDEQLMEAFGIKQTKNVRGDFYPDPSSPTGFSRYILDPYTQQPVGRETGVLPPAGWAPSETDSTQLVPDIQGNIHQVPTHRFSHKVIPGQSGKQPPVTGSGVVGRPGQSGGYGNQFLKSPQASTGGGIVGHKPRSTNDIKALDNLLELQQVIDQVLPYFERMKGPDGRPMKEQDSWIDVLKAPLRGLEYQVKRPSDPFYRNTQQLNNLITVMGTSPWTQLGRGKYIYDNIQKHLPNPSMQTPAAMYDRLTTLRGLIPTFREDILNQGLESQPTPGPVVGNVPRPDF